MLHIKSSYRISNRAFSEILKLLSYAFPDCEIPKSYDESKKYLREIGLGYKSVHVLTVCYFERSMLIWRCAQNVVNLDGRIQMAASGFLIRC